MINDYKDFVNKKLLWSKIFQLKKWLYMRDALGLMVIINEILEPFKVKLNQDEIDGFYRGLDVLRKTDFPESQIKYIMSTRAPRGIEDEKLIKDYNGKWSPINKLNTSYYGLTELLVYIIDRMTFDKSEGVMKLGKDVYNTIMNGDVKEGLLMLKTKKGEKEGERLKNIIKYYIFRYSSFKVEENASKFMPFTKDIQVNSKRGEISEKITIDYFTKRGFKVEYSGGNGDFIDMLFGCDIIVSREDIGYKSIQVKTFNPPIDDIKFYNVNWLSVVIGTSVKITDIKSGEEINL